MQLFKSADPMDTVERALKRRGWKYARIDSNTVLTGVGTSTGRHAMIAIRHEQPRKTVLFLFNPVTRPAEALQALGAGRPPFLLVHPQAGHTEEQVGGVCQILMHQNYGIVLGAFERDHRDGEIRYRIAHAYRDASLTEEQVDWAIEMAVLTLDVVMAKVEGFLNGSLGLEDATGVPSGPPTI